METMTSAEQAIALAETTPELPSFDHYTLILQTCRKSRSLKLAKRAHFLACSHGLENHRILSNHLVPMFVECGSIEFARQACNRFSHLNEYAWTSLIQGFVDLNDSSGALHVFNQMEEQCLHPSRYTFVALLKACAKLKSLHKGQELHAAIAGEALEGDPFLVSALVDMYAKCGSLSEAQDVFDGLPNQDIVCWTALITGYAEQGLGEKSWQCLEQLKLSGVPSDVVLWNAVIMGYAEHGETEKALKVYEQMQEQCLLPNRVTFLNVSKACGNKAARKVATKVHAQMHRLASSELTLAAAIIDMYGKCGRMVYAQELFDTMSYKSLVAWNALMTGHVHQGECEPVFDLFDRMKKEGVRPDGITYLNVLSVCSHGGLQEKGQQYFQEMQREYNIAPMTKHYNCMIDLLGRLGRLSEAVMMMEQMPSGPNYVTWGSLLGACQKWGDVEFCQRAFENALRTKIEDGKVFILMSNIYADIRKWGEAKRMERMYAH